MDKKNMKLELLDKMQIDEGEFSDYTPQQLINKGNQDYLKANETERALMYGSTNAIKVKQSATFLGLADDVVKTAQVTSDIEDNLNGIKYVIKTRFKEVFPDFNNGAAISLGVRISNAFKRVKTDELSIHREGSFEWAIEYIMKGIIEGRTTNAFFRNLRRNPGKLELFEEEMRSYIRSRWDYEMMRESTFQNTMTKMFKNSGGRDITKEIKLTLNEDFFKKETNKHA